MRLDKIISRAYIYAFDEYEKRQQAFPAEFFKSILGDCFAVDKHYQLFF